MNERLMHDLVATVYKQMSNLSLFGLPYGKTTKVLNRLNKYLFLSVILKSQYVIFKAGLQKTLLQFFINQTIWQIVMSGKLLVWLNEKRSAGQQF